MGELLNRGNIRHIKQVSKQYAVNCRFQDHASRLILRKKPA